MEMWTDMQMQMCIHSDRVYAYMYAVKGATRLDLDDVNGELVLVRWGKATEP